MTSYSARAETTRCSATTGSISSTGDGLDSCDGGDLTDTADPSCDRSDAEKAGPISAFLDFLSGLSR